MTISPIQRQRQRDFSRHPVFVLALYFACGIALRHADVIGVGGAAIATAFIIAFSGARPRLARFILPIVFVPLGSFSCEIQTRSVAGDRIKRIYDEGRIDPNEPVEIEGLLLRSPEPAYGGSFLRLRVERLVSKGHEQTASGDVRFFMFTDDEATAAEYERLDLNYGSVVKIACRLEREERFLNPGVASRIEMLDRQGIDAVGTIKSPLLVEKIGEESVFLPLLWAFDLRRELIASFRTNLSAESAGVMIASLLGDSHFLDRQTAETFRDGGTFHVLVISGLHITFIGGLTLWLVSFFTGRIVLQSVIASSFLWAYTFAVGADLPVLRASLMFSFLLLSRVVYRETSLLNALGLCTLLLLVWRPGDLLTASFQLTFVSVTAIVGCAFPLIEKLRAIGKWYPTTSAPLPPRVPEFMRRACEFLYWNEAAWRIENRRQIWSANLFKSPYLGWLEAPNLKAVAAYIVEGLLVSLIVQIWMLPLVVVYFHRVSPAGVLLNLWVGVFLALESFAVIAAVCVNAVSTWLAAPLFGVTEILNSLMMTLPASLSVVELAGFRLPVYSGALKLFYGAYAAAVAITAVRLFPWDPFSTALSRRIDRLAVAFGIFVVLLALVIVIHPFSTPRPTGRFRIDFLDVGQGDSALITFPNGETMLVDGGGRVDYRENDDRSFEPDMPRIGEAVVSEFLWEKGYSHIDYMVATHADADHMQGLVDVARNFGVGTLILGSTANGDEYAELRDVTDRRHVPILVVNRGEQLQIGEARIEVLNPSFEGGVRSGNNNSVGFRVTFASRKFLLTGDIERATEVELTSDGRDDLSADIVKVPHHGSRTSSTEDFVERVRAGVAVISVGRRSRFGHPHPEVVRRWGNSGADVRTTGERGTITVETDGDEIVIRTFKP